MSFHTFTLKLNNLFKKCVKFDLNFVYYLLNAYANMNFIYFETKQFSYRNGLITFGFFNHVSLYLNNTFGYTYES